MVKTVKEMALALPTMTVNEIHETMNFFRERLVEVDAVGDQSSAVILEGAIQRLRDRALEIEAGPEDPAGTIGPDNVAPEPVGFDGLPVSKAAIVLAETSGLDIRLVVASNGRQVTKPDVQAALDAIYSSDNHDDAETPELPEQDNTGIPAEVE